MFAPRSRPRRERGDMRQKVIRNDGAEMARLYNISAPTVSRIVAAHRTGFV
jgi:hypothetical protein